MLTVRRCMECISCGSSMLCLGYFAVVETPSLTAFTVLTTVEGFFATFSFSGYLTCAGIWVAFFQEPDCRSEKSENDCANRRV